MKVVRPYNDDAPRYLNASEGFVRGLFGLVVWELVVTSRFEMSLLQERKPWRWHTAVFILARVSLFVLLLLCAIGTWGMDIHTTASCQAYISTTQIAEGIAMTSASLLLTLRVFALWQNGVLAGFLTLGLVGQLSICMLSITIMKWGDPQCWSVKATSQAPYYVAAKYIYALGLDTLVFLLALLKLSSLRSPSSHHPLARLLRRDGLLFYIVALSAGAWQTSVAFVSLKHVENPYIREVMQNFETLGTAARIIAAGRMYISLSEFYTPGSSAGATRGTATSRAVGGTRESDGRGMLTDPVSIFAGISITTAAPGDLTSYDRSRERVNSQDSADVDLILLKTPATSDGRFPHALSMPMPALIGDVSPAQETYRSTNAQV